MVLKGGDDSAVCRASGKGQRKESAVMHAQRGVATSSARADYFAILTQAQAHAPSAAMV